MNIGNSQIKGDADEDCTERCRQVFEIRDGEFNVLVFEMELGSWGWVPRDAAGRGQQVKERTVVRAFRSPLASECFNNLCHANGVSLFLLFSSVKLIWVDSEPGHSAQKNSAGLSSPGADCE